MKISAFLTVHNEEARLPSCLEALKFVDEIVVVLDRCTDRSKEIAMSFGAVCVEGAWPLEGPRRQAAVDACQHPWLLEVDADEHVPSELASTLHGLVAITHFTHFPIGIDNYIGETCVRYGWGAYFGVQSRVSLFKRGAKRWGDQRVHPKVTFEGPQGPCLRPGYAHYVDDNISDMIHRFDRYTTARAQDLRSHGVPETLGHNVRRIFSRFLKCYIRGKGYKEGGYGLLVCVFAAIYPLISYLKATLEPGEK
jgi:glycosyltransferase involved in cell wall biosynthesis